MPAESCRWYPDCVLHHRRDESYTISRGKYKNPYDLATKDASIHTYQRISRTLSKVQAIVGGIHPKFRGLQGDVPCEFVLRSSITQLGVNAENIVLDMDGTERFCTITMDLVALTPLAILLLDFIGQGACVGKLFAREENRVVRNVSYLTRLLDHRNQRGEQLLIYGSGDHPDWDLKVVDGRVVAYLPVLPGTFTYSGEVHGLLPTIGTALKRHTPYKDLVRLHQEFHEGHSRICAPTGTLMVRGYAMHFRTLFGRVVEELLPKGLHSMSSRVIEPEEHGSQLRDRTFVFYGESAEELTHVPIEFFTVESFREHIPFGLRKTLAERCVSTRDLLKVFATAPDDGLPCCAYLCKGGQFTEMTQDDWLTADPQQIAYAEPDQPEERQEQVQRYVYQQCEYALLSAIAMDDISSEGVLLCRYFPSPSLKSLILSRMVGKKLRAIFFTRASRHHGQFFSQDDSSLLGDLTNVGIAVMHVDERKGEMFQYIRRAGMDAGQFVPINRRQDYLHATMFGVYGSNLVAGDFEAELMLLLNGILQVKRTAQHPLLNATKPIALLTGGGPGAMEVGNRVARSLGILSCGLVVDFGSVSTKPGSTINEQKQNPYCEAYFTYRADKLVERQSDFNLDFPIFLIGGIGTDFEYALEEVRRKVGTVPANPILLFGPADHWGAKIASRYSANRRAGTIRGSEWISTVPWIVESGQEALEVYTHFFAGTLPIGPKFPANDRGYMVASEFLQGKW
ncbi:hypothetical protein STCU_03911 [Strigomonas culicis]|uniref:Uncharacterized protein n=1 Tax=Strigomonas culicis TaxID=28005 RepID=S9W4G3_9TRYP|nr:hypothetical protein STCU_08996 [Strigomonas culicis]EPY24914.1 hypothetical protein STCU_06941 [Strigomonas culicis]EPY30750.1 hypothetical protein STCU_03911 [Strigomonas culicis]|eukprot:EPY20434.1 hypothetical protein STCU_08996 [Strigomonas culicis]